MSTYKREVGSSVQNFTNDPDNPITGQVWYNVTAAEFRYQEQVVGAAWATGNPLNTARYYAGGAGTQTAGLAFGGNTPTVTANTEQYDGTSWTEVNDLNVAKTEVSGLGIQTSALSIGGGDPSSPPVSGVENESWNGTS